MCKQKWLTAVLQKSGLLPVHITPKKNALSALLGGVVIIKAQKRIYHFSFDKKNRSMQTFLLHWGNLDNTSQLGASVVKPDHSDVTQCDHKATPVTSESAIFRHRVYI